MNKTSGEFNTSYPKFFRSFANWRDVLTDFCRGSLVYEANDRQVADEIIHAAWRFSFEIIKALLFRKYHTCFCKNEYR